MINLKIFRSLSFFALTVLLHSSSQFPAALAQDIERYGNFKIDVSNKDSMKNLVNLLRSGTKRSDFDKLADSPKWHAPYLMQRTSPDGKLTAEITDDGFQIRKANTDVILQTIKAEKSERNPFIGAKINDLSWSPDSKKLIFGAQNGLHLLDLATGNVKHMGDPDLRVSRLAWSPTGKYIAIVRASDHFKTYLEDLVILEMPSLNDKITHSGIGGNSIAWSNDGKRFAFYSSKGSISVINVDKGFGKKDWAEATIRPTRSGALCWSSNAKFLAVVDYFSNVKIYQIDSGKPVQKLDIPGVANIAWSNDGKSLLLDQIEPVNLIQEIPLKMNSEQSDLLVENVPEPKPGDSDFIPNDLEDCYKHLDKLLPVSVRSDIKDMPVPSDVIKYHHGLGTFLRNSLGLWSGSTFKDYINKNTKEQHPDEISHCILRGYWYHLHGEQHDVFADMSNSSKKNTVKLEEPKDGLLLDQRRIVFSGLNRMKDSGLNIDDYAERFNKIESMVENRIDETEISERIESVRKAYSRFLGRSGTLCDQLYDDGPLCKLCREIENSLMKDWKRNKAFQEKVWFFCYVQPDGTISNIEADNPKKYGPAACSKGKKLLSSLKLKSPSLFPIPLVVALNNENSETEVYVRHLNFSPYWYVFDTKVKKYWNESKLGQDGQVKVRMRVYRDGNIKNLSLVKGSGDAEFDKKVMEAMDKAPSFGHFPDGSHEYSELEQTWGYRLGY